MRIKKIILPLALSGISIGALYAYREYSRSNIDISNVSPDYQVQDTTLLNAFLHNEQAAGKKFVGKVVSVSGVVRGVELNKPGNSSVVLGQGPAGSSVTCILDSNYIAMGHGIETGHTATLKGVVVGFNRDETGLLGSDVQLVRCVRIDSRNGQQKY